MSDKFQCELQTQRIKINQCIGAKKKLSSCAGYVSEWR